jgi:hypothetical protein
LITATEYLMALALRGKKLPCIVYCWKLDRVGLYFI